MAMWEDLSLCRRFGRPKRRSRTL